MPDYLLHSTECAASSAHGIVYYKYSGPGYDTTPQISTIKFA